MSDTPGREMTLDEWVAKLPEGHRARRELSELRARVEGKRAPYTLGRRNNAHRRALNVLDEWLDVTGCIEKHTGYYYELQAVIEDAAECGAQAALNIYEPLPGAAREGERSSAHEVEADR